MNHWSGDTAVGNPCFPAEQNHKVRPVCVDADTVGKIPGSDRQMKINPDNKIGANTKVPASKVPALKRPETVSENEFSASTALTKKLATTPAVRSEEIARAKKLIASADYPAPAAIQKIARHLAEQIRQSDT